MAFLTQGQRERRRKAPFLVLREFKSPIYSPIQARWRTCKRTGDTKSPLCGGFLQADDGTRTHDLLHGNCAQLRGGARSRTRMRYVQGISKTNCACERVGAQACAVFG